jgi:hypothetical protein
MYLPSNPWKALWNMLPRWLQNRYTLTVVLFLFIMLFIDRHNLITQWRLWRGKQRLETDKVYYKEKIEEAKRRGGRF